MGRKKFGPVAGGGGATQETFELKPFCYYCDKEFDTVKTLITHQRTKHFNCSECGLKFDTVTGLRVHMLNAYKKTMKEVPNANPGRENPDIVVHGMEGLPKGLVEEKTRKARAEKAEKDKQREEESRERLKQMSAMRAAEARAEEDSAGNDGPAPPEAKRPAPSPPEPQAPAPPPQVAPPYAPGMVRPPSGNEQPEMLYLQGQEASEAAQRVAGAGMPGLSPAVARLLAGGDEVPRAPPDVPGLVRHSVPPALNGLHPVALQALAFAGALPLKGAVASPHLPASCGAPLGLADAMLAAALAAGPQVV